MVDKGRDRREVLLGPAYTAAHRALGRLDDEDVPAQLRPVRAASKKRSLPPPHRTVLARHLEEEWLRTLAAAELVDGDGPAERASRLFLTRAAGWEAELEEIVEAETDRSERHEAEALRSENERLRRLVEELGARLEASEGRIRDLTRDPGAESRVEAARRRMETEARGRSEAERAVRERDLEIERLRREIAEADERIGVLRSRGTRASAKGEHHAGGGRSFGRGAPLDTARLLDELMETMRPRPSSDPVPVERARLELPHGVRPDSPAAVEWIRTVDRPVLVIVDGHNVAHDFGPDPGRTTRDRIVSEVARLRRLSEGPLSAVVFFDTAHDSEAHVNHGVTVRYVPDADRAIEEAVAAAHIDCIVISTDQDVRRRAAAHGALSLWGTAFSDWISRR